MAVADVLDAPGGRARRPSWATNRSLRLILSAVVFVSGLIAADAWFQGGTFLLQPHLDEGSGPAPVGVPVNFGIDLDTRGGRGVVLESVTVSYTGAVDVREAVLYTPWGGDGIGTVTGSISWADAVPVRGYRLVRPVPDGEQHICRSSFAGAVQCEPQVVPIVGYTSLIVTVTPTRPGPWTITHVRVSYRSWWRNRVMSADLQFTGSATSS